MGFDNASRFHLVEQAAMMPGKCFITGTTAGQFVDTGMSINKFDGIFAEANQARIYLSVDVLREMAEGAGLFEDMERRYKDRIHIAYTSGYTDGVAGSGDVRTSVDRILSAADILRGTVSPSFDSSGQEAPGAIDPAEGIVLVTNGPTVSSRKQEGSEGRATSGQGNGTSVLERANGVSGNSSHELADTGN